MTQIELQAKITQTIWDNEKCIIAASPRSGKTKATLNALSKISGDILISVPSEFMINIWKTECEKWSFIDPMRLYFCCHASLHKQPKFDTLVIDEIHSAISEIRLEGIKQIKAKKIIGLSGSMSQKAIKILEERLGLNIKMSYSVDQAVSNDVIKDYCIYIHEIPLLLEEQREYDKLSRSVAWAKEQGRGKQLMFISLKRSRFLHNLKSKNTYVKKLINNFDRYLCFTQLIGVANNICEYTYNSKSGNENLELFKEEKINSLGLTKLANEGISFNNLDTSVIVGINSSEISMIQRILRSMTKEEDNMLANIHVIVSKQTQESLVWLPNALQSFNSEKIKII